MRLATRMIVVVGVLALVAGCVQGPPRSHARFLYTQHAALFVDDQGRGAYLLELREIRNVPPLAEIEVSFDRPGGAPWVSRHTVEAADKRFRFATPVLPGFDAAQDYYVRVRLLSFDRFTELDTLRQRIAVTPAGARPEVPEVEIPGDS